MTILPTISYKNDASRRRYYYQRLQVFYQKPVTQVSAAVLFTIATIIFFSVFAIKPTLQTIAELLKKIETQKTVLEAAEKKAAALATAQQQYEGIQSYMPVLSTAIPEDYDIQALLKQIEAVAGNLEVPLTNLHVSEIEYPPGTAKADGVREITFTLMAEAPYPVIESFISALQALPRLISIESLSLNTPDTRNQAGSAAGAIQAHIACRVYYVTNTGTQP